MSSLLTYTYKLLGFYRTKDEFPAPRAVTRKMFPFDDVIMDTVDANASIQNWMEQHNSTLEGHHQSMFFLVLLNDLHA